MEAISIEQVNVPAREVNQAERDDSASGHEYLMAAGSDR